MFLHLHALFPHQSPNFTSEHISPKSSNTFNWSHFGAWLGDIDRAIFLICLSFIFDQVLGAKRYQHDRMSNVVRDFKKSRTRSERDLSEITACNPVDSINWIFLWDFWIQVIYARKSRINGRKRSYFWWALNQTLKIELQSVVKQKKLRKCEKYNKQMFRIEINNCSEELQLLLQSKLN